MKKIILKNQPNKLGLCTVYLEQTTKKGGVRSRRRISTKVMVLPSNWSSPKQSVLGSDINHEHKNKLIEAKYLEVLNEKSKDFYSPAEVVPYLDRYVDLRRSKGSKRTSYKEFITVRNRLVRYDEFRLSQGLKRLSFEDINLRFSDDHIIWMSNRKYDPNTIKKHFVTLSTFLNHYYKRIGDYPEILLSNDFQKADFGKVNTHKSPPLPLTKEELKKLLDSDDILKPYPGLRKVRDAFVFGCATGLRFGDLFRVSQANIRNGIIYIEPAKTEGTKVDNQCKIPLNTMSEGILRKYEGSTSQLRIANQYYNRRLKRLFQLLGFDDLVPIKEYRGLGEPVLKEVPKHELLSSHNARDTFITLAIKAGIDIPSIMEMTGHTKYETMKKYIKIDDSHLINSMNKITDF